jgi:hypothetical protein
MSSLLLVSPHACKLQGKACILEMEGLMARGFQLSSTRTSGAVQAILSFTDNGREG